MKKEIFTNLMKLTERVGGKAWRKFSIDFRPYKC